MAIFTPQNDDAHGDEALQGRETAMPVPDRHFVNGAPLEAPFPAGLEQAMFGLGCFWGAERKFWQQPGVYTTAVGYAGGYTPNPTYEEVCSGRTGHTEVVLVVFDPTKVTYEELLKSVLGEPRSDAGHAPGQRRRHAVPLGDLHVRPTRSAARPRRRATRYQAELTAHGYPPITTEIRDAPPFYYAEDYHQQYLAKNPGGYCGIGGTGVNVLRAVRPLRHEAMPVRPSASQPPDCRCPHRRIR